MGRTRTKVQVRHTKAKPLPKNAPEVHAEAKAALIAAMPGGNLKAYADALLTHTVGRDADGRRARFKAEGENKRGGGTATGLAALAANRSATMFGGPNAPRMPQCIATNSRGLPCRQPACRGTKRCRYHGGRGAVEEAKRQRFADYKPDRSSVGRDAIKVLIRGGLFPLEALQASAGFAEVFNRARHGVAGTDPRFAEWSYAARRLHHEQCVALTLTWAAAWEAMQSRQDHTAWADCVRRCAALGING